MRHLLKTGNSLIGFLLGLGCLVQVASAQMWVGGGADNLWSNPDNWAFEIPNESLRATINGPDATAPNGPVIADGIEAVTELLIGEEGISHMTMTGGSLELTGWGMWWGDSNSVTATFDMSGGVINFTGSPGIMEMAWQEAEAPSGGSNAIWNMTGGEINALGVDMPAKGNGGIATITLDGGTLNVGTAREGLKMYDGGSIDITGGQLVLEGPQFHVDDYIQDGWIVAYGGDGQLVDEFDGTFRTISATLGMVCGDFDMDGDVDSADRTIQTTNWTGALHPGDPNATKTFAQGDCDADGDVDTADQNGTITNWTGAMNPAGNLATFQIGQTDPLNQGAGPVIDLGDVFPAGIATQEELAEYLTLAEYASELGSGGTLDLEFVPEPSGLALAVFGIASLIGRRRRR